MLPRVISEDIDLVTQLAPDLRPVRVDVGQIEEVLLNLVLNARDAMPEGGQLTITTANAELDEAFALTRTEVAAGPYAMLAVSDTGVGMDAEVKANIFEPFFTTKGVGRGTGLGLAAAYGTVKQNGGHIEVDSTPGRGTTFRIYLPAAAAETEPVKPLASPQKTPRGRETILLVEDDEALRLLARGVLQNQGYTVLEAVCGYDALEVSRNYAGPIQLLVTDVVMPRMCGRQLADALVTQRPGIRVLFLSGHTEDTVLRHGVASETVDFLTKPFTPDVLIHKVHEVLVEPLRRLEIGG
jgi:CheY-like chemotaxis protein